jgi:integrase
LPTANTLTDALCRKVGPGKHFDGHGLFLHVTPSGGKTWRMAYRLAGKPQTATFGPYPLLTLADARKKRDELRRQLLDGADPRMKVERRTPTVSEAIATYWTTQRQDVSSSYRDNVTRGLARHLEGELGARPIGALTKDELLATLNKVDAAGKHEYVRKVRVWIAQVLDWAVAQGWRADNPARAIDPEKAFGKSEVESHAALELHEVPDFLRRLNAEGQLLSVLAAKMVALTWVRTGELRMMLWSEVEGDLWRIPKGKMKRRRDHLVPLSKQAQALLVELKARSRGEYVFPNDRRADRPMSENSILYLIGRIGYAGRMTGHGFRSVGSTWANERGYNPDAIEMQLAHWAGGVRAVYNRAAYLPERRRMLQDWADWIDDAYAGRVKGG